MSPAGDVNSAACPRFQSTRFNDHLNPALNCNLRFDGAGPFVTYASDLRQRFRDISSLTSWHVRCSGLKEQQRPPGMIPW
jgi:hypothetical protein